ncbi:MAG: hypothetical protein Q7W13_07700 [Bacteroidia bacterium]|nr:hypothetical protein [Bacteroidia bacterium]
MFGEIETIENSEFNNIGALLGIDGNDISSELLGALRALPPIRRQMAVNKLTTPPANSKGSRAEMEKHFKELPGHIKGELAKGNLRLADALIYSIKPVTSKTIKMFETQDDKEIGIRNVSNAKLPKNQSLLVSGIVLLAGISATASKDDVMATTYDRLEGFPAIANGESNLKANKKIIMPETSNNFFKTLGLTTVPVGYYKLSNPRLIHDDIQIEFTVELGTMSGILPNTQLFVGLHGTITTP